MFVSEQTQSLVFNFESYECSEEIGTVEVPIDELIKHGLQHGTLKKPNLSPEKRAVMQLDKAEMPEESYILFTTLHG